MLLLPKTIGPFTLKRKLGTGGIAESYAGTHDNNGGRLVVVRRVLPYVLRDASRLASIEGRVRDLLGVRHPFLVHLVEHVAEGEEHFIVEEYVDGVSLDKVLAWCRQNQRHIPHNVFLNIATQVCNGLEALHGRAGKGTSAEHVLHLALKPGAVFITRDGKVMLGSYGLTRSPTTLPHGGVAGPVPTRMEYLSPEQTHPDQKLTPASDIFALGAVLYELLTLEALFRAESNLQTIHRVRRAEVTTQLLRVKELMPGLDKVLYRALSLNPRHRYQRAFVLREDLRGLMAGYSFATIAEDTRTFLAPLLETIQPGFSAVDAAPDAPAGADTFNESPITHVDLDPMSTAAFASQAMAERAAREQAQLYRVGPEDAAEHTENTSPRGVEDPPTEVRQGASAEPYEDLDRPTLPGEDLGDTLRPAGVAAAMLRPPADPPLAVVPDPTSSLPDWRRPAPMAPIELAPPLDPAGNSNPSPADTAAYLARSPQPPSPPPAAPPSFTPPSFAPPAFAPPAHVAGSVGPPPVLPPPPTLTPPPPANAGLSRPMPGPSLSRSMPGPGAVPPKPMAAAPRPAAPVLPTPPIAPLPVSVAPQAAPAPVSSPPQRSVLDDYDTPPPSNGKSWLLLGGAAVALIGVFSCAGLAWFGMNWAESRGSAVVEASAPATPVAAAPGDAASVMADEAPPRLEPIEDDGTATTAGSGAAPAPIPETSTPSAVASRPEASSPPPSTSSPATAAPPPTRPAPAPASPPVASSRPSTSAPPPSSSVRPASTPAAPTASTSRPAPAPSTRPESTRPEASTARASTSRIAPPSAAPAFEPPAALDVSVEETPVSDLDQYVEAAKKGKLQSMDMAVLDEVDIQEPNYTRSRALLLMNAQRKGDDKATRTYLDQLMLLPENHYNPVYLTDYARWHVNHAEYDKALEKASLAERYWARIPAELVFSKKAEIYEIQAASYQGKFYKSDEDMELLASAIKGWERYRQHAATKARTDLQKRADAELAKLQDIKEKIQ